MKSQIEQPKNWGNPLIGTFASHRFDNLRKIAKQIEDWGDFFEDLEKALGATEERWREVRIPPEETERVTEAVVPQLERLEQAFAHCDSLVNRALVRTPERFEEGRREVERIVTSELSDPKKVQELYQLCDDVTREHGTLESQVERAFIRVRVKIMRLGGPVPSPLGPPPGGSDPYRRQFAKQNREFTTSSSRSN